jgi:hypothetical protein
MLGKPGFDGSAYLAKGPAAMAKAPAGERRRAEKTEIAQQVPGVVQVENNLGSAAIFEWD